MIIFGTRGVTSTMKKGNFICPQCEQERPYKHKKVTRFFTLYFIPLIPLGKVGEYVECQSCKGTFIPKVLDYHKDAAADEFLSEYEKAIKHCMVLIMLADGIIDDNEMIMVQQIVNKFSHHDVTLEELEAYTAEVQKNPEEVATYLKRVTPNLNEHGKETIIKCALAVAAADDHMDESEMAVIEEMSKVMEMSAAHYKGIISEMNQPDAHKFSQN